MSHRNVITLGHSNLNLWVTHYMETVAQDAAPRKLHFISCVTLGGVKGGLMRPSSRQAAVSIHKNPL